VNLPAAWKALWSPAPPGDAAGVAVKAVVDRHAMAVPWAGGWPHEYGRLPASSTNWGAEACPLWLSTPVMACLGWIYDNFATADLAIYTPASGDGQDDAPDFEADAVTVFDNTDGMDAHELLGAGGMSDALDGETFYLPANTHGGDLARLIWAPRYDAAYGWGVEVVPGKKRLIEKYRYHAGGREPVDFAADEVVFIRAMVDPEYPYRGISRLKAGLRSIVGQARAETYLATFLRYGAARQLFVPDVSYAGMIDEPAAAGIRSMLALDLDRAGQVPVATVPGTLQAIGANPTEAVPPEIQDRFEATICALMGVSPMLAGLAVGASMRSYANQDAAEAQTWRNCLIPKQDRFARAFTRILGPRFGLGPAQYYGWDRSKVTALREDRTEAVNRAATMAGGKRWTSINEVRAEAGLPPVDWGDDMDEPPPDPMAPPANPPANPDGDGNPTPPKGGDDA
jgi:hypothetical protein